MTNRVRWMAIAVVAWVAWGCSSSPTASDPAPGGATSAAGSASTAGSSSLGGNAATGGTDAGGTDAGGASGAGLGNAGGTSTSAAAAKQTAESNANACSALGAFYWEIGDKNGALASGSVVPAGSTDSYDANTVMAIASASKWLYSAYFVQRQAGVLTEDDIKFLHFTSGYTNFTLCLPADTVDSCEARGTNGQYSADTDGYFYYDGGHMQKHASLNGLGSLDNEALASEIRSQIGTDIQLSYLQPQLAGGASTSATEYAKFLRKILRGELLIAGMLGSHAVCTNPNTCPSALSTPGPATADLHYSLGHWVEDDAPSGDGAFSSAGAFGFYPWVDATKTLYGVLARKAPALGNAGMQSLECGRLIRAAWKSGSAL